MNNPTIITKDAELVSYLLDIWNDCGSTRDVEIETIENEDGEETGVSIYVPAEGWEARVWFDENGSDENEDHEVHLYNIKRSDVMSFDPWAYKEEKEAQRRDEYESVQAEARASYYNNIGTIGLR